MATIVHGDKVSYLDARTQMPELGTVELIGDSLSDGTIIVTITRENGTKIQLPTGAFQKQEQSTVST